MDETGAQTADCHSFHWVTRHTRHIMHDIASGAKSQDLPPSTITFRDYKEHDNLTSFCVFTRVVVFGGAQTKSASARLNRLAKATMETE